MLMTISIQVIQKVLESLVLLLMNNEATNVKCVLFEYKLNPFTGGVNKFAVHTAP